VIGIREGMGQGFISLLISAFVWGSLLFQVPLGVLGDRIGRKNLLILVCSAGSAGMFVIPHFLSNEIYLFVSFILIGGLVGSLYSMGLACATDLLPARFLPAANAIASVHFSVGSILGPSLGGFSIEKAGGEMLFITIGCMLAGYVLMILLEKMGNRMNSFKSKEKQAV
jgi:MFS family permease